jgi:hypothetical protein
MRERADRLQRETLSLKTETEQAIRGNIQGFADAVSLSHRDLFGYAEALWRPGTKVSLKADQHSEEFLVRVDTDTELAGAAAAGRHSLAAPYGAIRAALRAETPPGLTLTDVAAKGDLNVFYVKYSHPKNNGGLGRLLGN